MSMPEIERAEKATRSRLAFWGVSVLLALSIYQCGDAPVSGGVSSGESRTFMLPGGGAMEMVWIEPGVFQMGSENGGSDEYPVHEVKISRGFWLGKYEVTQGEWETVMGTTPWSGHDRVVEDASRPAVNISWNMCQEFIGRLNAMGEDVYRLPTEAEWEYACRAGTQTRWSFGDDENRLDDYAWVRGNSNRSGPKPVGGKLPNDWGLYDMHGNAWEWVQDWYGYDYYNSSPRVDPQGPAFSASSSERVYRGGSFSAVASSSRSASRGLSGPDSRIYFVGMRILRIR